MVHRKLQPILPTGYELRDEAHSNIRFLRSLSSTIEGSSYAPCTYGPLSGKVDPQDS